MKKIIYFLFAGAMCMFLVGCEPKPDEKIVNHYMDEIQIDNRKEVRAGLAKCLADNLSDENSSKGQNCANIKEFSKRFCLYLQNKFKDNENFKATPLDLVTRKALIADIDCNNQSDVVMLSVTQFGHPMDILFD